MDWRGVVQCVIHPLDQGWNRYLARRCDIEIMTFEHINTRMFLLPLIHGGIALTNQLDDLRAEQAQHGGDSAVGGKETNRLAGPVHGDADDMADDIVPTFRIGFLRRTSWV